MKLARLSQNDYTLILEHFNALSNASLRSRFGFSPSQSTLENYANFMFKNKGAVLAVMEDEQVVGLAHLSFEGKSCELGLSIIDSQQGKGIGKQLMDESLWECVSAGIHELNLLTTAHNFKVLRLLRSYPHDIKPGVDGSLAAVDVIAWHATNETSPQLPGEAQRPKQILAA